MQLYFRNLGQGQAFIILHGLYGSSDNWLTIAKQFSDYFEVFIPDLRNHGQSPHSIEHNYQIMSRDLLEFMNSQNIRKATILGHSMGGKVAMLFANNYPERIIQLIIADIAPKSYSKDYANLQKHSEIINSLLEIDLKSINSFITANEILTKKLDDDKLSKFLLKNLKKNKEGNFEWKLNLNALYTNIENLIDGFDDIVLQQQSFPTLFLKGENSDYIKVADFEKIKSVYKNCRIIEIKNAGHWLHAEQPEMFAKEVIDFVLKF